MERAEGVESVSRKKGLRAGAWLLALAALLVIAGLVWASDWITMQNERTIYTVDCTGGGWQGVRCSGKLKAADRCRFRGLGGGGEGLFWVLGTNEPSGRLAPCTIASGRNWTCKAGPDAGRSITLQMSMGRAVSSRDGTSRPFHAVPKWRWYLLRWGIALGHDATD